MSVTKRFWTGSKVKLKFSNKRQDNRTKVKRKVDMLLMINFIFGKMYKMKVLRFNILPENRYLYHN